MDYQVPPAVYQDFRETTYSEVFHRVKDEGKEVWVTFGLTTIPTWAPAGTLKGCDTIPGIKEAGVFRCYRDDYGVPKIVRHEAPAITWMPSGCANGQCQGRR